MFIYIYIYIYIFITTNPEMNKYRFSLPFFHCRFLPTCLLLFKLAHYHQHHQLVDVNASASVIATYVNAVYHVYRQKKMFID